MYLRNFYTVQISTVYEKIILKFGVLFTALARPGTILSFPLLLLDLVLFFPS